MSASGRWGPSSNGPMTESASATVSECPLPGEVPRWEVPGWRERFGVVAGVTGRGASGFDLGLWTGEPVGAVSGRWRQFLRAEPGFTGAVLAHQVHGTVVLRHPTVAPGWTIRGGADGHATSQAGLLLLVTVADCVPVYLVDPVGRAVALLHAGWRGVAGGVLEQGVTALIEVAGSSPAKLVMHCGVAISGGCYEVGNEVAVACGEPAAPGGKQGLDLRGLLADQASRLGLGQVTVSGLCTATRSEAFYSHRRSGGRDGRQVAYLGIPADPAEAVPL